MRKLTFCMNLSLDGYIAAPGDDLGWSVPSDELFQWWSDRVRLRPRDHLQVGAPWKKEQEGRAHDSCPEAPLVCDSAGIFRRRRTGPSSTRQPASPYSSRRHPAAGR
jgi:hypothetical protein